MLGFRVPPLVLCCGVLYCCDVAAVPRGMFRFHKIETDLDNHTAVSYKPDADKRKANRFDNGLPFNAIPAGIEFHNNRDWVAYKQLNDRMKQAWAKETSDKGESHVKAHSERERSAGLRAIGGARHEGRSSSMKMFGNQLRSHGMAEYGYTIGDFTWPHHVSAIGDIHLICCDRFETAVRDTCQGVAESALKTYINNGNAGGKCHETSCFDGQGMRQWAGSLSWLDYTEYRWGNRSFTERSECQENRDWPDLMEHFRSMAACNGGLGKLLVPNRFHVWACFHNHPCATRALTDPVGLWILYEQGYKDFSIEQVNILVTYISGQIDSVPTTGVGSWNGTANGAINIDWNGPLDGTLTYIQVQNFFVFLVEMVIMLGDAEFEELNVAEIFGNLWWIGLASGQTGTCEATGRDGFTCREDPRCFFNPMLGCQSQPPTHPAFGSGFWRFWISAYGYGAFGDDVVSIGAQYSIYMITTGATGNENSFWGCMLNEACGEAVAQGNLLTSGATYVSVDASYGSRFFIVFTYSGYNAFYYSIDMFNAAVSIPAHIIANLNNGEDRIMLRWNSSEDLDLWMFVRDPPNTDGSEGTMRGAVGWDFGKKSLTVGQTVLQYQKDSMNGIVNGPEVAGMTGAAGGVYEVWVNLFSEPQDNKNFTREMVQMYPASVDVYCYRCHFKGVIQSGGVGSFTQDWTTVPEGSGVKWWKVGDFIAPSTVSSSVRLQWRQCTSNCYYVQPFAPKGTGTLQITATDAAAKPAVQLSGKYYVYSEYRLPFEGCFQSNNCGKLKYNNTLGSSGVTSVTVDVNYGVSNYLVVVVSNGYYASYSEQAVNDGGTRIVAAQMVTTLSTNQDRLVLRWRSNSVDLDLRIVFKTAAGVYQGSVGWNTPGRTQSFSTGSATLDVDNFNGAQGPETTIISNLANGKAEVWVNMYPSGVTFTPERVRADPATVDVYCGKCHNDAGSLVQGIAKSSTQIASSVPAAGVKWWKVGQFVAPSPKDNAVRAQWETCQSGCYTGTTNNVPGATRRRRSTGPTDVKPALQDADVVHGDPYMNKIMASRLKKADKEREERIALKTAKKEQRGEKMNSLMHKRARYYNLKNTDGGGIRSTYSTPDDAKKKDHGENLHGLCICFVLIMCRCALSVHGCASGGFLTLETTDGKTVKNAGREWTENDKKVVMPFIRNIQVLLLLHLNGVAALSFLCVFKFFPLLIASPVQCTGTPRESALYIYTHMDAYMHTCMHTYIHACIHINICSMHTYIHACIHINICIYHSCTNIDRKALACVFLFWSRCSNVPWNGCKTNHQSLKHAWAKRYGLDTMEEAINTGAFLCACACACAFGVYVLACSLSSLKAIALHLGGMEANILAIFASSWDLFCPQGCLRRQPCLREHYGVVWRCWCMMGQRVSVLCDDVCV